MTERRGRGGKTACNCYRPPLGQSGASYEGHKRLRVATASA